MPVWLTIIRTLIPELIKLILAIFNKSKDLPTDERDAVRSELKELAWRTRKTRDAGPLRRLKERIEARVAELKK